MIVYEPFEVLMRTKLSEEVGDGYANSLMARFHKAADDLAPIWTQIAKVEPDLSDHGPDHISNVLRNAHTLIGEEDYFNGVELYLLAVMVLFHDVGNLKGRKEHNKKMGEIYDSVRAPATHDPQEKVLVLRGAGAHCGYARDGSADTLAQLGETTYPLDGHSVRLRELAAVLRFADELAEGPQRTCLYAVNHGMHPEPSKIYHVYASVTHVHIDRRGGRINLAYNIPVVPEGDHLVTSDSLNLVELLGFTYKRIFKLDQERRYNSYYAKPLTVFNRTEASFNFLMSSEIQDLGLGPVVLRDLVVPGETAKTVEEWSPKHKIETIEAALIAEAVNLGS